MIRPIRYRFVFPVMLISAWLGFRLAALAAPAEKPAEAPKARFEVQVSAVRELTGPQNAISLPIIELRCQFFNDSDRDVAIPLWGLGQYNDLFQVEITGPDGKAVAGPARTQVLEPIPALNAPRIPAKIGDSPFSLVKAKGSIECTFSIGPQIADGLSWLLPHPGKYKLSAAYVNTHLSYVDSKAKAVVNMDNVFIGSLKAPPVEFTVSRNGVVEGGFDIYDNMGRLGKGRGSVVLAENPGNRGLTLAGTIIDKQGKPVPGTVIEIVANKVSGLGGPGNAGDVGDGVIRKKIERQRTGADGKYEFTDLPPYADSFLLETSPPGNYVSSVVVLSNTKKTNRTDLRIIVEDGVSVRGKVVDRDGKPLGDVGVRGVSRTVYAEDPKLFDTGESPRATVQWIGNMRTGFDGTFTLKGIKRTECQIGAEGMGARGFQSVTASPPAGHAEDGTWTITLEPRPAEAEITQQRKVLFDKIAKSEDVPWLERLAGSLEEAKKEFLPAPLSTSPKIGSTVKDVPIEAYVRLGKLHTKESLAAIERIEKKAKECNRMPETVSLGLMTNPSFILADSEVKLLATVKAPDGMTYGVIQALYLMGDKDLFLVSSKTPDVTSSWTRPKLILGEAPPQNLMEASLAFKSDGVLELSMFHRKVESVLLREGDKPAPPPEPAAWKLEIPLKQALGDQDKDGWTDSEEFRLGLNPKNADTDGDGLDDGKDPCPNFAPPPGHENDEDAQVVQKAFFAAFGLSQSRVLLLVMPTSAKTQVWGYPGPVIYMDDARKWSGQHQRGWIYVDWTIVGRTDDEAKVQMKDVMPTIEQQEFLLRKIDGKWIVVERKLPSAG
jgi:hypothetical protein